MQEVDVRQSDRFAIRLTDECKLDFVLVISLTVGRLPLIHSTFHPLHATIIIWQKKKNITKKNKRNQKRRRSSWGGETSDRFANRQQTTR